MYELKKNRKVFTSKFVGTGPSSYEKRIYRAVVSQKLRNTDLEDGCGKFFQTVITGLCRTSRDTEYSLQSSAQKLQISHKYPINYLLQCVQ